MKTEPWEKYPEIWKTKSAFFVYLRGGIRSIWNRYPAKLKWKNSKLISPPIDYKGRAKKLGQCYYCKEMFAASNLEVDHIEQSGNCSSWEDAFKFIYRLLDCNDNWVLACKPCHKIKSYSERMKISFGEARLAKEVIEIMKLPKKEILALLQKNMYNTDLLHNDKQRKEAIEQIMRKNNVH